MILYLRDEFGGPGLNGDVLCLVLFVSEVINRKNKISRLIQPSAKEPKRWTMTNQTIPIVWGYV